MYSKDVQDGVFTRFYRLVREWPGSGQFLQCEVRRDVLEAYTAELLRRTSGE